MTAAPSKRISAISNWEPDEGANVSDSVKQWCSQEFKRRTSDLLSWCHRKRLKLRHRFRLAIETLVNIQHKVRWPCSQLFRGWLLPSCMTRGFTTGFHRVIGFLVPCEGMQVDCHVHSNYSDGRLLSQMIEAGAAAGLDRIGIADHCNVIEDGKLARFRNLVGHNLDRTYDRRRDAIVRLRQESEIRIYDAVEMDFHPTAVADIDRFLQDAAFEYSIGSVHFLDGENIHIESYFRQQSREHRPRT